MRVGLFAGDVTGPKALTELVDGAVRAEEDGFASYWLPWIMAHDPMVALALAGQRTTRIELGTAVMRTYTRNPADLAPAAVTVAVATGGRFVLGVGPSHRPLIEDMFGYSFDHPAAHTEEYLSVLTHLLTDGKVDHDGGDYHVHFAAYHPDGVAVPVIVAALGPRMLELAGRLANGTFTWMTGPVCSPATRPADLPRTGTVARRTPCARAHRMVRSLGAPNRPGAAWSLNAQRADRAQAAMLGLAPHKVGHRVGRSTVRIAPGVVPSRHGTPAARSPRTRPRHLLAPSAGWWVRT
jgi:alkanesulfonate monooxygenase SsuD/methylene tetrahydromethanopterin reductase-like flavin-dependent oxidoreductase (luciferase family)